MNMPYVIWTQMFRAEQTRMIRFTVEKGMVSTNLLEVQLLVNGLSA